MDRNRDNRKSTVVSANGLSRRRHRTSSLRDSPDDAPRELQETGRLRDRGSGRKDRDRERDREREDRDRERSSRSKKRRVDRLMHGISRQDCADESTEESVNVEDEEEDGGEPVRATPATTPATASSLPSTSNHLPRKSFPPAKFFRMASMWKVPDEMIGVSVPRKARSVSTKRPHDSWAVSAGTSVSGGRCTVEPVHHRQASTSPARQAPNPLIASSSCPISPSSSNASARKKMSNGSKQRPSKTPSKSFSSNQEEIEFEIAEVLYGLRQNQDINNNTSIQDLTPNDGKKRDVPDAVHRSCADTKSCVSSPISHSSSAQRHPSIIIPQSSISLSFPVISVAPKRKKPRAVKGEEIENHNHSDFANEVSVETAKREIDRPPKDGSPALPTNAENSGSDSRTPETLPELVKPDAGERKAVDEDSDSQNNNNALLSGEETSQQKKTESPRNDGDNNNNNNNNGVSEGKTNSSGKEEERFQIDLMAPPPGSKSPSEPLDGEMLSDIPTTTTNKREIVKLLSSGEEDDFDGKGNEKVKRVAVVVEESQVQKNALSTEVIVDLEKVGADSGGGGSAATSPITIKHSKSGPKHHKKAPRHDLNLEKHVPSGSGLPFPVPISGWPGGISPMGYVGPLQGLVSLDGGGAIPPVPIAAAAAAPHQFFSQPRPKRCATHCYIARNICCHQQFTKMNSLWPPAVPGAVSLFTGKPAGMDAVVPAASEAHSSMSVNRNGSDKEQQHGLAMFPVTKDDDLDNGQQKKHPQILIQPAMPPGAPSSNILHAPAFLFPLNQQQPAPPPPPAASFRSGSVKSGGGAAVVGGGSNAVAAVPATSFGYPTVAGSETQYLAILQNNAYPFPIPAHMSGPPTSYRASAHGQTLPFFNGSFYSSHHVLHSSQFQQQQPSPSPQLHHQTIPSLPPTLQKQQTKTTTAGHLQQHQFQHQHSHQPSFPSNSKTRSSSSSKLQNNSSRHLEDGGEFPRACNFALPLNSNNFAILPEKMQQPPPMPGVDGVAPGPGFAMSFASMEPSHGRHYHIMPGSKSGGENAEEERKIAGVVGKPAHSIAFSRPELVVDGSSVPSSSGDGSARAAMNLTGSATSRLGAAGFNSSSSKRHHHHHHHLSQQQQLSMSMNMQQQLEKQRYSGGSKNKTQPAATESVAYSADHLPSMTAKFSSFPQSHAQWKNALSPAAASLKAAALPPQQTCRGGPAQHISFGGNLKSCVSTNSRAQSPPMISASPSTSSVSKGGGSPNRGAASKSGAQLSALSALQQQAKAVASSPTATSTSISSPSIKSATTSVAGQQNSPMQQQQQLFFSNPYLHSAGGGGGAYYMQRRRSEQQQPCSSGMLSLCPPSAVENGKGVPAAQTVVGSSSQPGFPYLLPVHLKSSSDQKHPTGE